MSVKENIINFKDQLPESVKLIAVSKTKPNSLIMEAYDAGQRIFGENKVQDLAAKQPELPTDIRWHFIGHLQRNKVKFIASFVDTIHAVDSLKLLKEINKQAVNNNRTINCLLQFHIAEEESKFGLNMPEAEAILNNDDFKNLQNIKICGVMGMATYTNNLDQVRKEFNNLKTYFNKIKSTYYREQTDFVDISMGMSGDYKIAIDEGSTMIRIGSSIFGSRGELVNEKY